MEEAFLALVRLGIGNAATDKLPDSINWNAIEALAKQHGLLGVLVDGVNRLPHNARPPQTIWLRWIGELVQGYESQYMLYRKAVVDLTAWYHVHGYRMMVLKGLACGVNWPKPEHRPYGDIDIYLFGQYKEADAALTRDFGIKVDNSHHHHTVFQCHGFMVENHYDFINVHARKSNKELEQIFKTLAEDDSHSVEIYGNKVYLPSPNLHALFLIRHMAAHFSSERLTIRQLLDWAFFVKNNRSEIDWNLLEETLDQFGLMPFYKIINAICVDELGLDLKLFPEIVYEPNTKDRVLREILSPAFADKEPQCVWKRIPFKYKRWKSNSWKQELCYKESMKSALWSGIKSHLMKPASI